MASKTTPHQTNSLSSFGNLTFDLILTFYDDHYATRAANPCARWVVPVTRELDGGGFVIEKSFDVEDPLYAHMFPITGSHAIQLQLEPIGHPYYNNPIFPLVTTRVVTAEALNFIKNSDLREPTLNLIGRSAVNASTNNVCLILHKLERGAGFLAKRLKVELPANYCDEWLTRYILYRHQMVPSSTNSGTSPKGSQENDEHGLICPCCGKSR